MSPNPPVAMTERMSKAETAAEREPSGAAPAEADEAASAPARAYRVLARKYRPVTFAELIGQEAMVRTLTNAMASGRLAHAFILTGVRGVGKTSTARIIARALNCIGPDGTGGPTIEPCGVCEHCRAIIEDRHIDVIELDAASRTRVDEMREVIDGVHYKPVSARFKVYIIDEVHMLSRHAFNALLKTLEEPPEHVTFIFATTEIRKVPVTVLSRCQRFDLRRLHQEELAAYFAEIAGKEGVRIEERALAMIARAADGSVRDGLSLLDQAIAHAGTPGDEGPQVTAEAVRDMLGLADRAQTLDLFDQVMAGRIDEALALLAEMYRAGADPLVVLQDLLELTHWLTRLKIVKEAAESAAVSETERRRGREMAEKLAMADLARTWQMLLKGLGEVQQAPQPLVAVEMLLVRLAYAAELPSPAELVKEIVAAEGGAAPAPTSTADGGAQASAPAAPAAAERPPAAAPRPSPAAPQNGPMGAPRAALAPEPQEPEPEPEPAPQPDTAPQAQAEPEAEPAAQAPAPESFPDVVALFDERREPIIATHLRSDVHLVRFEPGRIEFRPGASAPADLASRLGARLSEWTGRRWVVSVSGEPGAPTLAEAAAADRVARHQEAALHPLVKRALELFPGAEITDVRRRPGATPAGRPGDEEETT